MGWCSRYFRVRDVRGFGIGDIEIVELCRDVVEKLVKGMDDGKVYSVKDDVVEFNFFLCLLLGICSVLYNYNYFFLYRVF